MLKPTKSKSSKVEAYDFKAQDVEAYDIQALEQTDVI